MLHRAPSDSPIAMDYEEFPDNPTWFRKINPRKVLLGIAKPKEKTKGGIILTANHIDIDARLTQLGKVLAVGALAYSDEVPEGERLKVGDVVIFKLYQGLQIEDGKGTDTKHRYRTIDVTQYEMVVDEDSIGTFEFFS
jgi:co-chaperonin GroES (HSP10)